LEKIQEKQDGCFNKHEQENLSALEKIQEKQDGGFNKHEQENLSDLDFKSNKSKMAALIKHVVWACSVPGCAVLALLPVPGWVGGVGGSSYRPAHPGTARHHPLPATPRRLATYI
jgi:hypothetical protein